MASWFEGLSARAVRLLWRAGGAVRARLAIPVATPGDPARAQPGTTTYVDRGPCELLRTAHARGHGTPPLGDDPASRHLFLTFSEVPVGSRLALGGATFVVVSRRNAGPGGAVHVLECEPLAAAMGG